MAAYLGAIALGCYKFNRNIKVYDFRMKIIDMEHKRYDEAIRQGLHFKYRGLAKKYSYDDMLNSFKPLKLENWFTEEEIHYLTTPIER